jgi:hypothetical protein
MVLGMGAPSERGRDRKKECLFRLAGTWVLAESRG